MNTTAKNTALMVRQLYDRDSCSYSYLLVDRKTHEGAIIDPVLESFDRDMQLIKELGVELLYTMETHAHADHITSSGKIRQHTGAKIVFGEHAGIAAIDIAVQDGQRLPLGNSEIRALATPGHTSACTCYCILDKVFTGDTLLIRGCGRADFQGGDAAVLYDSITQKLWVLDDETVIYPGHDYHGYTTSTIGEEKRWNARLGGHQDQQSFIHTMKNLNLDMPKKINEAVPANTSVGIDFNPDRYLLADFSMDDLYRIWQQSQDNTLIVDNRTADEFATAHVPGSVNIPLGTETDHLAELRQYERVYIYCRSGRRAQTAFINLSFQGAENLTCICHSGMPDWVQSGYAVEM